MSSYERRCWRRRSESCHTWSKRADAVAVLRQKLGKRGLTARPDALALGVLDLLLQRPELAWAAVGAYFGVPAEMVRSALERLEADGIVRHVQLDNHQRAWCFSDVLA